MSASLTSASWPGLPQAPTRPWSLSLGRAGDAAGARWMLKRQCALTPGQLGRAYAALCALSLLIAVGFAVFGAPVVLMFSLIELAAVGAAIIFYARHVGDGDMLTLRGRLLSVEQIHGNRSSITTFRAEWVTVEPSAGKGSLVELSGQGQRVHVGRFVRPEMRATLAHELRQALRLACQPFSDSSE